MRMHAQEEEERVLPRVPFSACLESFAAPEVVDDYDSAAAGKRTQVRVLQAGRGWLRLAEAGWLACPACC